MESSGSLAGCRNLEIKLSGNVDKERATAEQSWITNIVTTIMGSCRSERKEKP
jgi:hypothetical protein